MDTTIIKPTREDLFNAKRRIEPYIHKTPVLHSRLIDSITGCEVFFKCENFQKAGAFKFRGAINSLLCLSEEERDAGVCTHSSGNHAQALALAASLCKVPAYIVMPENASIVKVQGVKSYGGKITFCRPLLSSREETLAKVREQSGATEIHPYNYLNTIEGQGSAAIELFEELGTTDIIMAPVGGGGLLSGTALASRYISPQTKIVAAEPQGADDAWQSFYQGLFIPSTKPKTIADGLLTSLGSLTYPIIKENVDAIVRTSDEYIIKAMKLIWERMKIIVEPSSAVPLAAILQNVDNKATDHYPFEGKRIAIIISGGNVDLDKLPWIK